MRRAIALIALICLMLPGCAAIAPAPAPPADLAQWFDCLRERGEAVISAHRAGPAPGLPENALETMAATLARNPDALLEIDVQQSFDGVLFLLHDRTLERTTTGRGSARNLEWTTLRTLQLRDNDGAVTASRIPSLAEALALAVARNAVVQLDVKRGIDFAVVIAAVREARAERHAIIITYNDTDAMTVARLAPELMISAEVGEAGDADRLVAGGLARNRLLAWTGVESLEPALFAALRQTGVEPMFGTFGGRPGLRLDDHWLTDGDPSEFATLERNGAVVIATDYGARVERALGPITCRR